MAPETLLHRYILLHNQGVSSGDFSAMVALFADSAEFHFTRVPVGPFIGKEAIAEAFSKQPPSDELVNLLVVKKDKGSIQIRYGWKQSSEVGTLEITALEGKIKEISVF